MASGFKGVGDRDIADTQARPSAGCGGTGDKDRPSFLAHILGAALLLLAACATPQGQVIHVREILEVQAAGPGGATLITEAELLQSDAAEPWLRVSLRSADGRRQPLAAATPEEARATLAALLAGSPLREALPPALRSSAPAPASLGTGPWPLPLALEGLQLELERVRDFRYGPTWIARIRDNGFAHEAARFHLPDEGEIELLVLAPDLAAFRWRAGAGRIRVQDLAILPLQPAAQAFFVARAEDAMKRGALEEARAALERAFVLETAPTGALWFTAARLAARQGEDPSIVRSYLERAIAEEPTLYRMQARTSADFETLRENEDIQALIAPRPLPGTHRHQDTRSTEL